MRKIVLQQLSIKGFKSFRRQSNVRFSGAPGLIFLSGENKAQKRLGANGAGKSSLWDALVWCLYSTSVKGTKASDLVSWGGSKSVDVACTLRVDERYYTIRRTSPPNRLYINDEPVEQGAVQDLIGLTRDRFLHSVIFGQAVPLFPDLSMPERAALLDEVLDLGLWLRLSELAGKKTASLESGIAAMDRQMAHAEGQIQALQQTDVDALEEQADDWEHIRASELDKARKKLKSLQDELEDLQQATQLTPKEQRASAEFKRLGEHISKVNNTLPGLTGKLLVLRDKRMDVVKLQKFFHDHKNCPTCLQAISAAFVKKKHEELEADLDEIDISLVEAEAVVAAQKRALLQAKLEYDDFSSITIASAQRVAGAKRDVEAMARLIRDQEGTLTLLSRKTTNPYEERLIAYKTQLKQANKELVSAQKLKAKHEREIANVDYWKQGFRKVRLFMVKRVLSYLELETANAVAALGLTGWKITYATETETKSGTSKVGIQILVESPTSSATWEAWSGGEGQRLRIAIALGLSTMIQRMAGVEFKFEVFDEPSAWLSAEGIEDLLDYLQQRAQSQDKAIWLLDHRALIYTGFSEIWTVVKNKIGGSEVIKVN